MTWPRWGPWEGWEEQKLVWWRNRWVCGLETHKTPGGRVPSRPAAQESLACGHRFGGREWCQWAWCVERGMGGNPGSQDLGSQGKTERGFCGSVLFRSLQEVIAKGTEQNVSLRERGNYKGSMKHFLKRHKNWILRSQDFLLNRTKICFVIPLFHLWIFSVRGIFQTRILEQVALSYSRESFWSRDQTHASRVSCIGGRILFH